jgi:hypothetical protein
MKEKNAELFLGFVFVLFAFDGDAERAEEVYVVLGESAPGGLSGSISFLSLLGDFIESDCGFEHKKHIEAVLADVLDYAGDLLALDDRFVDCLSELLDQFFQARCHGYLRQAAASAGEARGAASDLYTLLLRRAVGNCTKAAPDVRC